MEIVKVTSEFYEDCKKYGANENNQLLESEAGRPCVLILSLKYRGKKRKFVVPMKSNIKPSEDKRNKSIWTGMQMEIKLCLHQILIRL